MAAARSSKRKLIILLISVILFLIFLINFVLTYLANLFIASTIVPQLTDEKGNVEFNARVRLLPSLKLSIHNFEYKKENKPILKIEDLSVKIAFWQLFSKKLHITKVAVNNGVINLYNLPVIKWNKTTKDTDPTEKQDERSQDIKKSPETTVTAQEESFFKLDKIELTNMQINYSPNQTSPPVYLKTIDFDNAQAKNSEYIITVLGNWGNEPINATLALNLIPNNPMLVTIIHFAGNELFLTGKTNTGNVELQTHIAIKNREILAQLLSIPLMHLPTQMNASINISNHQLSITPIQIVFPSGTVQATMSLGASPIMIQIVLPQEVLTELSGSTIYQECPLPIIMNKLLKGINTEIRITTPQSINASTGSTLIKIDGLGIQFEGNAIPEVLQKNLQVCFDYKLPDESSHTTYSID